MSVPVDFNRLMDYVQHERGKWKAWLEADPSRLRLPFQPGGRFPTINSLVDHVFFVERRHLSRLQGAPLPEKTGVAEGDITGLFEYADRAHEVRHLAQLAYAARMAGIDPPGQHDYFAFAQTSNTLI